MPDRERCFICTREIASEADWERNAELPSEREDEEAKRLGLDELCWEPGQNDNCLAGAIERGRPIDYISAMKALDSLRSQLQEEVERLREGARRAQKINAPYAEGREGTLNAIADRLSKLLSEEGK